VLPGIDNRARQLLIIHRRGLLLCAKLCHSILYINLMQQIEKIYKNVDYNYATCADKHCCMAFVLLQLVVCDDCFNESYQFSRQGFSIFRGLRLSSIV
jgi:hypothetical protein